MAFEDIEVVKPAAPKLSLPEDGVAVRALKLGTRKGGEVRYIRVTIGPKLARAISLTQEDHGVRVLFGTGSDAGMLRVSVDNEAGKFRAKRNKSGAYNLTINSATAEGLFSLEFPTFKRPGLEALRPQTGQPPHFVFKASEEMLAVED